MKSAHPEIISIVKTELNKRPIDTKSLVNIFPEDCQQAVGLIVGALFDIKNTLDRTNQLLDSLSKTSSKKVTPTSLANFFTNNSDLLREYSYQDNKIYYKATPLDSDSIQLVGLSLQLEDYFGNQHINFKVLLTGLKRYLISRVFQGDETQKEILELADNYLSRSTTKKRTKIALKYLRDNYPNSSASYIKSVLLSSGYKEAKDSHNCIYFIKGV